MKRKGILKITKKMEMKSIWETVKTGREDPMSI